MRLPRFSLYLAALVLTAQVFAQTSQTGSTSLQSTQTQQDIKLEPMDQTPTFRVNVVGRTATAINYRHRGGATKIDFKGTNLMPNANGEAKVESKQGYIEIEVEFDDLGKPTQFGNEYLTYVMWAITPEGRATNLGEVLLNGNRSKLNVTSELQAFGLIVTAEPYFAVTQPSNLVVLENVIRPDTVGKAEVIMARYELLEKGGYVPTGTNFAPTVFNSALPLEFYEARNAVRIAELAGAQKYASDSYIRAAGLLKQAEDQAIRKNVQKKALVGVAREAVQGAEDARLIALRKREEERVRNEQLAAEAREAKARAETEDEARRRREAEMNAEESARRQRQSELEREEAERRSRDSQRTAEEANRMKAEADAARAEAMAQQLEAQKLAEQNRLQAEANRRAAEQSEQARMQAEKDKEALRKRLLDQLNTILETRDTARGLIVNMSDVLFDSGRHTLRPQAREKLAKISGIVLAYPELRLDIEGHTDSVGSNAYNQKLSERRASSVADYLRNQGVGETSIAARGLGEEQPIASNASAKGKQQNRRVELVVSGEVIGTRIGQSNTSSTDQQ